MATNRAMKSFANEMLEDMRFNSHNGGLGSCNQCGSCTAVCPAARYSKLGYDPREIVKRVLEGDRSILQDPIIWECFYCYSCNMACPQRVDPCTVVQVLRYKAVHEGHADEHIAEFVDYGECFWEFGIGATPNAFFPDVAKEWGKEWQDMRRDMDAIRERLGLMPAIPPWKAIEEMQYVMRESGFLEHLAIFQEAYRRKHQEIKG